MITRKLETLKVFITKVSKICWASMFILGTKVILKVDGFIPSGKIHPLPLSSGYQSSRIFIDQTITTKKERIRPSLSSFASPNDDVFQKNEDSNIPKNTNNRQQSRINQNRKKEMENRLETSLSALFDISKGPKSNAQDNPDILEQIGITSMPSNSDAPKLDENMYLNSEQYLNEDGSILGEEKPENDEVMQNLRSAVMNDRPSIPLENNSAETKKIAGNIFDDQALLESLGSSQNNSQDRISGDDIHRQIFANEKGFLEQSEAFRKTLSTEENDENDENQKKMNEAAAWRRGADYRRRQELAMAMIEDEMNEIEKKALSIEDAKELAAKERKEIQHLDTNEGESETNSKQPTTFLCSKCGSLMDQEEVASERRRGRGGLNQMICRFCQVDAMRVKNGSPYLMGRLGRNGKPPPSTGMDAIAPTKDKRIRKQVEKIRNMAPITDDYPYNEMYGYKKDNAGTSSSERTEEQSIAWRDHFTSVTRNRGANANRTTKDAKSGLGRNDTVTRNPNGNANNARSGLGPNDTGGRNRKQGSSPNAAVRMPKNSRNEQNDKRQEHKHIPTQNRYTRRVHELDEAKGKNQCSRIVWIAARKAALHRTGKGEMKQAGIKSDAGQVKTSNSSSSLSKSVKEKKLEEEMKRLRTKIADLESTVEEYEQQLKKSSKQVKAMKSVMDGMNNFKKSVKRKHDMKRNGVSTELGILRSANKDSNNFLSDP